MLDYNTSGHKCLPLAENHHLAWCIGLVCGVRPGSMGPTKRHKDQFLTFKEIELTRVGNRYSGMFNTKITFLYLKRNRGPDAIQEGLTFHVNGASTSHNLPMSIPHRLLIILLRRQGLQDHDDLDSLLNGQEIRIRLKDAILKEPVLRKGGPWGLSVSEDPLTAD